MCSSRLPKGLVNAISQRSSICSFRTITMQRLSSVTSRMTIQRFSESNVSISSLIVQEPSFSKDLLLDKEFRMENQDYEAESKAPSVFELRVHPTLKKSKPKTTFMVYLTETKTTFMLEIQSSAEPLDSTEGKQ